MNRILLSIAAVVILGGCSEQSNVGDGGGVGGHSPLKGDRKGPTETADAFIARVNAEYKDYLREFRAAEWVYITYITVDSAHIFSLANERYAAWRSRMVKESLAYADHEVSPETRRALDFLKQGAILVAPDDDAKRKEQAQILANLQGAYGAGKYCRNDAECFGGQELENLMEQTRNYDELLEYWIGWRSISPPMRDKYTRYAELANEGANELGYGDLGEMWRSGFDMTGTEFQAETGRLWEQVKPLYEELHCAVRAKLGEHYGEDKVPQGGPIPAHLLGNMWAQEWGFIYDIMEPYPGVSDLDVDSTLKTKNYSPQEMVRSAEDFYVSLGMERLPDTFWERSQFSKPRDREVVCHASAESLDADEDLRIKMCIEQTYEDLRTIYHELGHNFYQRAYNKQPLLFQEGAQGAHDGFHEAIGDTITLSMTPEYLAEIGLVASAEQSQQAVINRQMQQALDKLAFLPFGKLIDEWRWGVFSGEVSPENYNAAWWDLRLKYQGIAPPVERSEADFDPGAKYHIPANVSYTRYFLARILQFQFQRSLCEAADHEGGLHECSIFGSKKAGARLTAMLGAGASEPWQNTLEKLTGTREMDATAIIDYFAPLMVYLKEQNQGRSCGW